MRWAAILHVGLLALGAVATGLPGKSSETWTAGHRRPHLAGQDTTRAERRAGEAVSRDPAAQDAAAPAQDTLAAAAAADTLAAETAASAPIGRAALLRALPALPRRDLPADLREPRFRSRAAHWTAGWARRVRERAAALADSLWIAARAEAWRARVPEPMLAQAPAPQEAPAATRDTGFVRQGAPPGAEPGLLPDAFSQYADLRMQLQGRLEVGGGWSRFRPCDLALRLNCDPGIIPTLKPDLQFGIRVGGTVSERIHVNVDYDNAREFDAANNINVYYQGLEDEILQRVEVGDVSFDLPPSRYLTRAIPAGNFGFRATGQVGPVEFQTIWAQQKGDLGTRTLTLGAGGQGFVQDQTTVLDDADYQRGQFFFLFHPRHIRGYPHIDILRLQPTDANPEVRPASTIKVYRYEGPSLGSRQGTVQENTIEAIAVAQDTLDGVVVTDTLRGTFRVLAEGNDFVVHVSGLWLVLKSPVAPTEGLAVVYRTATGREVGTFDAEGVFAAHVQDSTKPLPVLELLKDVNHRPGEATWEREMHQVYRVSGSGGVETNTVDLTISQGDAALDQTFRLAPSGTPVNFLKIFGLDDEPSDERLDVAHLFQPASDLPGVDPSGPGGTYIVFPTLRPFLEPPPLRGLASDPALDGRPFPLAPSDRNAAIYEDPIDVRRQATNLYRLTLRYRVRQEGVVSTFNLGAVGVREGSERITIGGVPLQRGTDYDIDYATGQVNLRDPAKWFGNNPGAQIQVAYEQKPIFQLAPTTVFGLNARAQVGRTGQIQFVGLSQTEKSLQTRPELGLEPGAMKLAGMSGRFEWESGWLTRAVNALPFVSAEQPSAIHLEGELATSLPTTNTGGTTYVEDFEGGSGFDLFLASRAWQHGSRPPTTLAAEDVLPPALDASTYARFTWQDQWVDAGGALVGPLSPRAIDDELLVQSQTGFGEPVLYLTMSPPAAGNRGWRSITTVLSATGRDFTTVEFLEFYVAVTDEDADSVALVLDLGTVSEDAFVLDSLGLPAGLGRLDQEADRTTQIWSDADDVGLWGTGCQARRGVLAYPLGHAAANCTRGNGLNDTEDLNGDNQLQTDERFFRYVVRVGDETGPYFVRNARALGTEPGALRFRLFRIPLRRPDHVEGATFAEFQNIRHLRMTVAGNTGRPLLLVLARMRFLGSRWLKRGDVGVVRGLVDTLPSPNPASLVEVGPISTLDPDYAPPPGITDQLANRTDVLGTQTVQFNEQSLRVRVRELGPDDRGEVYLQYPQTPRDMLTYRALRVWALGARGPWGTDPGAPLRFFLKVGEDAENFYLYRTPLAGRPEGATREETREAWRPEIVVDFERWIALRTAAEDSLLRRGGLAPGERFVLWDADALPDGDSTYAVVISQRSRPPNLAAVRQISVGIWNAGTAPVAEAELWVDDVRLDRAADEPGLAGQASLAVRGSDVFDLRASYEGQNPYFRQLGDRPNFLTGNALNLGGSLRLGRFLPAAWAVDLPLSVSYAKSGTSPFFLPATDVRGDALRDLRTPERTSFRTDLSLRRTPRGAPTPLVGWLVDRLSLRLSWSRDRAEAQRSSAESRSVSASLGYGTEVGNVSLPLFPGFLRSLVFFLPDGIRDAKLRLTPQSLNLDASLVDATSETRRFDSPLRLPGDTTVPPIRTFRHALRLGSSLRLLPLPALEGRVGLSQERDLVPSDRVVASAAGRRLIDAERARLLGFGIGWETSRQLDASFNYRPTLAPWFTPSASFLAGYSTNRNASYLGEDAPGDTVLQRDFGNTRRLQAGAQFNPRAFLDAVAGTRGGPWALLRAALGRLDLVQANWTHSVYSDFRRQSAEPGLGYQLALGDPRSFRVVGGDTATRVVTAEGWSLGSGLLLPWGAVLSADIRVNASNAWTPRSEYETETVEWPSLQFTWGRVPLPAATRRLLQNVSFRLGYSERETNEENLGTDQTRFRHETRIPASISVALARGWQIHYTWDRSRSLNVDPAGRTEAERTGQSLRFTAQFRPPPTWRSFRNPIRVNVGYRIDATDQCRALGVTDVGRQAVEGCAPFTDLTVRNVDVTVDTDVQPFTLGLQASWRDQQSGIGQRPGSTQLDVNLFGRFFFQSGPIR